MPIREAYIAIGSNIGDREQYMREAINALQVHEDIQVIRCSHLYETEPVGFTEQAAFLNMVIAVHTTLEPLALLEAMMEIEGQLGRVRELRWGPRKIDLDMLLYEGVMSDAPELLLPHPRMHERMFVLIPLKDVYRSLDDSDAISLMLTDVEGKDGVQLWKPVQWQSEFGHFVN
jgi:2-amino-4-hydroxy-6-hydroxymethyldihydropteridine diphosphokinase